MEFHIVKELCTVAYSFILGLIFGGGYDIIRMIHLWCGIASFSDEEADKRVRVLTPILTFFLDACMMTAGIAAFSFFIFWTNNGRFRWYMAAGTASGMAVYFATLGRIVSTLSEAAVGFLKSLLKRIVFRPICFFLLTLGKAAGAVFGHTVKPIFRGIRRRRAEIRTNRIQKNLERDIRFPEIPEKP